MEPLVASISKTALLANVAAIRRKVGPMALCGMVKADAYGHGVEGVARTLAGAGVEFLAVARVEEAEELRRLGLAPPILLCEPSPDARDDAYLRDRLEAICHVPGIRPTIADAGGAAALAATARRVGVGRPLPLPVHVKVDTGMGRNGAPLDALDEILRIIDASGALELEGVYTHLATADEPDESFARQQLARFERLIRSWAAAGRTPRYVHATGSAGLARFDSPVLNLARPGIALYGYQPNPTTRPDDWAMTLSPVLRLTARLVLVKELPAGHAVGYGCTWRTRRPSRIGLVPIGYGDGYNRRFGNAAVMQVEGQPGRDVPVVGRVSMDLTAIDLTELPDLPDGGSRAVRAGAVVTVISERREDANSVEGLALLAGTIPYEITCQIGRRVRRELVDFFPAGA